MTKFFAEPTVRLFLRALLVAGVTFATKFVDSSGHVTYSAASVHAALVGSGLAFAEIFTPLNSIVGIGKLGPSAPAASQPTVAPTTLAPKPAVKK